ncbi:ABC transporter substrate-binding protein [Blastococcus sp. BMG 814]|uniref:ABC transporter substrate-binding protein n=1 Tax=Blastococcus carthaginiensis TaxID=3050034 RepID=A0ABT9IDH5_9ACTN|nr:ABC transporter substrate-binding protein [Blastococcus carthaginiensis]MDP5183628.1 ABC transporter substrate-binding protein [Blastococcus carthaginiensis]
MHSTVATPGSPARTRATTVAAALLAVVTAAGCSSDGGGGGGDGRQFDAEITTDVPAATTDVESVTWNLASGEPPILDPAQAALENISNVVANTCESLMTVDENFELQPALAQSLEQPDELTYVFTLREGATFWNGNPVTADDVVFSVTRILDPALASPWAAWASKLESITATAENEVTLKLTAPDPLVEGVFALPAFTVVERAFTEQAGPAFGTAGVGVMCTGPYEFTAWNQGQSIELTRNENWWNEEIDPKVQSVTFTFNTDPAAQVASLRSGETDGQWIIPSSAFEQLAEAGNMLIGQSLQTLFISAIDLTGPMGDPAVAEALAAAIDYQGISEAVYRGTAPPLRALVPPSAWGYAEDVYESAYEELPEPVQDLDRVAELVAQTPAASEEIVLAYLSASDEEARAATAIADAANQAGMNIQLQPLTAPEFGAVFISPEARQGFDALLAVGYLDQPEPLAYYQFFITGSFYNFMGWSNPEYDALIGEALGTLDNTERAELVTQAQSIIHEEGIVLPIVKPATTVYYGPELTGVVPRQSYLYTPWLAVLGGE